jgi:RNA polymerase sigma factor (sigma-70 family)
LDTTTLHVRRAIAGDGDSAGWVIERLSPFVESQIRFRLGGRGTAQDIEDLVADTWVVTLERLGELRPRQDRLTPVLMRFLGSTALLNANNFLRREILRDGDGRVSGSRVPSVLATRTRGIVTSLAERELTRIIRGCLERLPADKREVLVLRLLEGKSNEEIASVLKLEANTVAARYKRAVEELRIRLPPSVYAELRNGRGMQ